MTASGDESPGASAPFLGRVRSRSLSRAGAARGRGASVSALAFALVAAVVAWEAFASSHRSGRRAAGPPAAADALRGARAADETAEVRRMRGVYAAMTAQFKKRGLDVKAVGEVAKLFGGLKPGGAPARGRPYPLNYTLWEKALKPSSVRLVVFPVAEADGLVDVMRQINASIAKLLPAGTEIFANAPDDYHCTLFHLSHLYDPRPDTSSAAAAAAAAKLPPHKRPQVTAEAYEKEWRHVKRVLAKTPAPTLLFDRVVLAPTGSVLVTWVDPTDSVSAFRKSMAAEFPGASGKQAVIIHTTLLRVLTAAPLPAKTIAAIDAACEAWTEKLRGTEVSVPNFWYVNEFQFSTIEGERMRMPLAPRAAGAGAKAGGKGKSGGAASDSGSGSDTAGGRKRGDSSSSASSSDSGGSGSGGSSSGSSTSTAGRTSQRASRRERAGGDKAAGAAAGQRQDEQRRRRRRLDGPAKAAEAADGKGRRALAAAA